MRILYRYRLEFLALLLVPLTIYVWALVLRSPENVLQVSFLSVGQGDSILVTSPTGVTMLIDGGPDRSVLRELPKELGYFNRSINMIVATHPDKDHIAGLSDVLARYKVSHYIESGVTGTTAFSENLDTAVSEENGIQKVTARRGMRIHLGGGAYADILYPDRDVRNVETNTGSIVMRLVYGDTSFMLTGDAPGSIEKYLVSLDAGRDALESDILKAGHHGSKTSTQAEWLSEVSPNVVVISAGKGNSYGHPAPEVVERITNSGARILSTINLGTIRFSSNGNEINY